LKIVEGEDTQVDPDPLLHVGDKLSSILFESGCNI
jgi:hypothetical protein